MSAQSYELIDAFSLRSAEGGAVIYPPCVMRVQSSDRLLSVEIGSHDPVAVLPQELDRLIASGIALPN